MPAKAKPKILEIRLKVREDPDPDLSWIGKFTNKPESSKAIDLVRSGYVGKYETNKYKYFEPGGDPEYAAQDFALMQGYENGHWSMVGLCAEADIEVPLGSRKIHETVESMCLWGIQTDSGGAYFTEVAREELDDLKEQLKK